MHVFYYIYKNWNGDVLLGSQQKALDSKSFIFELQNPVAMNFESNKQENGNRQ